MKVKYLLFFLLAMSMVSVAGPKYLAADELLGTWKYTVSNVPPEYESGFMTFEEKESKTVGYLGQTEKAEMKELVVDGTKITFKLDLNGGIITINLVKDGEKLSGTVVTQDGEFPINAVKDVKK